MKITEEANCSHFTFVNGKMCKFCGVLQCDLCLKNHELQHAENGDEEMSLEDFK